SKEEGRPATASPHAGLATHSQVATKAPCKGAADYSEGQPTRDVGAARRGSNQQGRPTLLAGAVAHRGGTCRHNRLQPDRRGGSRPQAHPLAARCLQKGVGFRAPVRGYCPQPALPPVGAATPAAPWQGGCRARVATACAGVAVIRPQKEPYRF
ncbi:hypothetical protein BHM03_00061179, partial [Ensete ventricosum]